MIKDVNDISHRQAAKIAGFGLLFMFISGMFGTNPIAEQLFDEVINAAGNLSITIAADLMMLVFDVVAALGLYVFLTPVNKSISLLSAWFRLLHVAVYGASIVHLFSALQFLGSAEGLVQPGTEMFQTQVMSFLNGHEHGFHIGLVFFGFHFLLLGYLIIRSTYVPKILGILLLIIAIGYLINSFVSFLMPNYEDYQTTFQIIVFIPAMVVEFSLCLWLLFKGGKTSDKAIAH